MGENLARDDAHEVAYIIIYIIFKNVINLNNHLCLDGAEVSELG